MNIGHFYKISTTTILFLLFCSPTLYIPGFIGVRVEELFLILFGVIILFASKNGGSEFKISVRFLLLLLFLPLFLVSTLWGALHCLPTSLADLTKLIWIFKSLGIYIIFYNYVNIDKVGKDERIVHLLNQFVKFAVISSVICFQQYFNVFQLNSLYIPLIAPTQFISLMPGFPTPRVVGMLGNANVQGYVLALSIVVFLYLLLERKNHLPTLTFLILFVALLMTLSRGAFVALVAGAFSLFVLYKKNRSYVYVKIFSGTFFLAFCYYIYRLMVENEAIYNAILFRFELLSNITEDSSFVARYDGWNINWNFFKSSPVFGVGLIPRATDIFTGADNEWLHFLRSFGIVGVSWLLVFLFLPLCMKRNFALKDLNLSIMLLSIIFLTVTYMIPAAVILSPVTFPFLLVLLAISDKTLFSLEISQSPYPVTCEDNDNGV